MVLFAKYCRTLGGVLLYHARNGVLSEPEEMNAKAGGLTATAKDAKPADSSKKPTAQETMKRKTLPLAVIAGMVAGDGGGKTDKLRWVYGGLLFPHSCGDPVRFCVKSFGKFHREIDEEMHSIELSLSLLVDTLLFGVLAARRVLRERVGKPYRPDPMSGDDR